MEMSSPGSTSPSQNSNNNLLQPSLGSKSRNVIDRIKGLGRRPRIALGAVLFLVILLLGWKVFFTHTTPAKFVLEATMQDKAGINPKTAFKLHSTQALSSKEIEKIVKFNPPIDFSSKQIGSANPFVNQAFAADNNSSGSYTYQLQPKEDLQGDVVYEAVIDDQNYADRDYGWAFQVKSSFQVIKTHPGNKTSYVPANTGIELTFNRLGLKNSEKYFDISPKVDGTFQVSDDTVVFLPKNPLAEHTVYTVTIKKGLSAEGSDDILQDDYQFSFETQDIHYQAETYVNFSNDFVESPPGARVDLGVYAYNAGNSTVNVYKIDTQDQFLDSYQKSRTWNWGWTSYYRQNKASGFNSAGRQAVLTFQASVVTQNYQSYIEIPQILDQGMYVVDVIYNNKHAQAWLQITPTAHYFSLTHDASLIWLYDFPTKSPLNNAKVEFIQSGSPTQSLGSTDTNGLSQFNTPEPLKAENKTDNNNPSFFRVTDQSNHTVLVKVADQWGYSGNRVGLGDDNYWQFMSTDRYTYQMSDTIRFWGVIKSRKEDVRQKKVKVALYDSSRFWDYSGSFSNQQPVAFKEVMVSPFNTIEGDISFKGLDPKTYSLVVTFGDETVSESSIEVLTYSKPSYQLKVSASKPAIYAGDSVTFTVKGTFFDGSPLAGTKVNYYAYWDSNMSGKVTLDDNGEGQVTVTPGYNENRDTYYPRSLQMSFSPASAEEGEIEGSASVLVFGPHMYIQSDQTKQSGTNYTFRAKLNDIDINNQVPDNNDGFRFEYIGGPVSNYTVQAKITKTTYSRVETGNYYDPINKTVGKTYSYVRNDSDLESITGTTNNNGEWSFSRDLPKADDTYYRVEFSVIDRQGRIATTSTYAYYATYDSWRPASLSLNIDNNSYEKEFSVNEQVVLTAQGTGSLIATDRPILYYRFQNNIAKVSISKSNTYSEAFGNDFLPSVQYRAVILGPYGFVESNSVFAIFKKSDNNIKINISTDKDSYRPGDKVTIKLHVTDKDGKPLAAETNVAIVDEAVFHVLPWNWEQQILDSLYQTIYTSPQVGMTRYLTLESGGGQGGAEGGGCFTAGTQILLASGKTKSIENIKVGDQLLTFKDPASRTLVPAIVQGISSHEVDDFLVINNSLEVTPEHKIFLNGEWNFAGNAKVGDTLVLKENKPEAITSITKKLAPHTTVYNIIVGKYHTYFADGYFVHNAEKGGTDVRDNFVDTATFQTLHPDISGNAQLEFTTPDNITSWRVTARSFDNASLKAGEQTKLIPSGLPLFINPVLSDTYLVGDNPQVKIGVYGSDYHSDQNTQVTVVSPQLKVNQNLTVKNHVGYVSLGALTEGEYDLTISAQQGQNKDALKKHITVVKSYFVKPTVSTELLTTSTSNIPGNDNGFTKLEFMDAGKGKFYQELLWNSYTGGLRSDQLAGSFYATSLLNDYFKEDRQQDKLDLSSYQTAGEGIRLFPYSDPDLDLSARIADLAPDYISSNDLGDYFTTALHDKKTDIHRQVIALYGLASLKKPVLTRLQAIQSVKELTLQDKIYIGLGLAKIGATEEARALYQREIRPHVHFDGPQAWFEEMKEGDARIKSTDLTAVLTADLNITDDANALWGYMTTHAPKKDLDILEKVMVIKAAIKQTNQNESKFTYKTNAKSENVTIKNGDTYSVTLSADELKSISFSDISGSVQVASFYEQSQDPGSLQKDSKLNLIREYTVNGKVTTDLHDGDVVKVKLFPKVSGSALDSYYQVIDYLPSGLRPIVNVYSLSEGQGYNCIWWPEKVVNNKLYFTVPKSFSGYSGCEPAIQYYARVVTKGEFTANPALIQSTLNQADLNVSESDKVNIK